jgi:hypothetical protein
MGFPSKSLIITPLPRALLAEQVPFILDMSPNRFLALALFAWLAATPTGEVS